MLRSKALITACLVISTHAHAQSATPDLDAARRVAVGDRLDCRLANYCQASKPDDATAIVVEANPVPIDTLASEATAQREGDRVWIGPFRYDGRAMSLTSADPRFKTLAIDPAIAQPRLPTGERVVVSNLLWAREGGTCRLALTTDAVQPHRGSNRATQVGAAMSLAGHRAIASWPIGHGANARFLGLMKPDGSDDATVLVTFGPGAESATHVVARLPLAFQGVAIIPPLHGGDSSLRLTGMQPDGRLVDLLLWFDPQTAWR